MSQLKETCKLLDETLTDYFDTLNQVYEKQNQIDQLMKDGFIHMAKARYSMGSQSVGRLQYDDQNMMATSKCLVEDFDEVETAYPVFSLITGAGTSGSQGKGDAADNKQDSEGLRQRKINLGDDDKCVDDVSNKIQNVKISEKENDDKVEEKSTKIKDPLKWFGVLVPQDLRQSQTCFKRSVAVSTDLATLKVKLNSLQSHYRSLMQQKEDILNSVSLFSDE